MEELQLKHLAPYLPYRLKIKSKIVDITKELDAHHLVSFEYFFNTWEYKPILIPIGQYGGIIGELIEMGSIKSEKLPTSMWLYLIENHFDVFDLIEKGLAIDKSLEQKA